MPNPVKQAPFNDPAQSKPLRLWPGVVIVVLQWLLRFVIPVLFPGPRADIIGVFGGLAGGLAIVVWWAFFSRAHRFDRWSSVILMIAGLAVTRPLVHESIGTGMQGMMFFVYAVPVLSLAFVIWAMACQRLAALSRRLAMAATILLACGVWTLVRSEGMTGDAAAEFVWRWAETPEERLLARSGELPIKVLPAEEVSETEAVWPGFRGPGRDAIIQGVMIGTDWSSAPPVELWCRPVGPGCSSFAVNGEFLYTQEQRGEEEMVTCYHVTGGDPVWRHQDTARFWDSHAGAGPRGTPCLSNGKVYTFGATGILNALDARDGSVMWSRNPGSDTGVELPGWGFASSPLVVGDLVIVAVAGTLIAYDRATGDLRWTGPDGSAGYSSPHLMTICGVEQLLLMSEVGATSLSPTDGTLMWKHEWEEERIVQPARINDSDLLLSAGGIKGIRRVTVTRGTGGWKTTEQWTSIRLRPNFNDFVVHKGHAYGYDGLSLACIDIEDGKRKWKSGRYGGQLLLLADQDLLLVLTEKGELVLVSAVPDRLKELARFPAIEGKTWNHPVLVGDLLLVRNAREMAAFRLPPADR